MKLFCSKEIMANWTWDSSVQLITTKTIKYSKNWKLKQGDLQILLNEIPGLSRPFKLYFLVFKDSNQRSHLSNNIFIIFQILINKLIQQNGTNKSAAHANNAMTVATLTIERNLWQSYQFPYSLWLTWRIKVISYVWEIIIYITAYRH